MPFLRERSGRWSTPKIVAFVLATLPALALAGRAAFGDLGPRPFDAAIRDVGDWAVRFLLLTLAITPARRLFAAPKLILTRRIFGVAVFCYIALHFVLYILDLKLDLAKVASEIVLRVYLTIGFVAFVGLAALAVTSTDAMVQRLGSQRWNQLHTLTYPIAVLAIVHFLMQTKLDISESIMMAGFLVWLLAYRVAHRAFGEGGPARLVGLAIVAALATALGEAAWYGATTGVDPWLVLGANLDPAMGLRPAAWVLATGLAVAAAATGWSFIPKEPGRGRTREPRREPVPVRSGPA